MVNARITAEWADKVRKDEIKKQYNRLMEGIKQQAEQGYYEVMFTPEEPDVGEIIARELAGNDFDVQFIQSAMAYLIKWSHESRVLEGLRPF